MNEIAQKLKQAREKNGVSIKEAAEDLKLTEEKIENIEAGNIKAFKDVFFLKYFIREYAKYLGLDSEKIVDEFNEFLFDYTSKIPVDEIEKAKKEEKKKQEPKKILSPYTIEQKKKFEISSKIIYIAIAVLVFAVMYFLFSMYGSDDFKEVEYGSIEYKGV